MVLVVAEVVLLAAEVVLLVSSSDNSGAEAGLEEEKKETVAVVDVVDIVLARGFVFVISLFCWLGLVAELLTLRCARWLKEEMS